MARFLGFLALGVLAGCSSAEPPAQVTVPPPPVSEVAAPRPPFNPVQNGVSFRDWLELLGDRQEVLQEQAVAALTEIGREHPKEMVSELIPLLEKNIETTPFGEAVSPQRLNVIRVLGRIGPAADAAVPSLQALVGANSDPYSREALNSLAVIAAGQSELEQAFQTALQQPTTPTMVRALQLIAEGKSNDQKLIPAIAAALEQPPTRGLAAAALANFGAAARQALPALHKAWLQETANQPAGVGQFGGSRFNERQPGTQLSTRAALAEAFAAIDMQAAIPMLIAQATLEIPPVNRLAPDQTEFDPAAVAEVKMAITHLQQVSPVTPDIIAALVGTTLRPEADIVAAGNASLDRLTTSQRIDGFAAILKNSAVSGEIRKKVAASLGTLGPAAEPAVPQLTDALRSEPPVAAASATALGAIGAGAKSAVPVLKQLFIDRGLEPVTFPEPAPEKNQFVQRPTRRSFGVGQPGPLAQSKIVPEKLGVALGQALAQLEPAEALHLCIDTLASDDPPRVQIAANICSSLGPAARQAVPALAAKLDVDEETVVACAAALGEIGAEAQDALPNLILAFVNWSDRVDGRTQPDQPKGFSEFPRSASLVPGDDVASVPATRISAAREIGKALIQINPATAVSAFVKLLDRPKAPVVTLAVELLGTTGEHARLALAKLNQISRSGNLSSEQVGEAISRARLQIIGLPPAFQPVAIPKPRSEMTVPGKHRALAVSPDGRQAAILSGTEVSLWDLTKAGAVATLDDSAVIMNARKQLQENVPLHFTPDGAHIALGGRQQVVLWKTNTREIDKKLWGHSREVIGLAFEREGGGLISAGGDGIQLWSGQGEKMGQLSSGVHTSSVALSPDGKTVVAGIVGGKVLLIDVESKKARTLAALQDRIEKGRTLHAIRVAFTADGHSVSALIRPRSNAPLVESADELSVYASQELANCVTWDLASGEVVNVIENMQPLDLSPSGELLIAAGSQVYQLVDAATGITLFTLGGNFQRELGLGGHMGFASPNSTITSFSYDGRTLLTLNGTALQVWDLRRREQQPE